MKTFCEVCNVPLTSEDMMATHERGKKHKKKLEEMTSSERKIFVTFQGSSSKIRTNPEEMKFFFSQYGEVVKAVLIPQVPGAEITFSSAESRNAALVKKVQNIGELSFSVGPYLSLNERKLKVPTKNEYFKKRIEEEGLPAYSTLSKQALVPDTIEEQIEMFGNLLALPEQGKQRRIQFCEELQAALRRFIPEVTLSIYGSTISGLGTKFGDLDLFLDLDTSLLRHSIDQAPPLPIPDLETKFPNLELCNGLVTLKSLLEETRANQLLFFTAALRNCPISQVIRNLKPITTARVPVLKFSHYGAGFDCDLGFGARMSVVNTQLMQLLVRIDDRFVKILNVLRMWAKQNSVSNLVWQHSLHSYALTLLLYFYLQHTMPPVLPSVKGLIDICNPLEECTVSGWNCSFTEDMMNIRTFLLPDYNEQTLPELIKGFFDFYANMDMFNVVICPHTGKLVDVMEFREDKKHQPRLQSFVMKHLHLQDPLELCHNVLGHVQLKGALTLISEEIIKAAVKLNQNQASWTLRDIIPTDVAAIKFRPDPDKGKSVFLFQPSLLPAAFRNFGSIENIEAQWHQWIVELTMKALNILRMEHVLMEDYDENVELFPSEIGGMKETTGAPSGEKTACKQIHDEDVSMTKAHSPRPQTSKSVSDEENSVVENVESDSTSMSVVSTKRPLEEEHPTNPSKRKRPKFEVFSHPSLKHNVDKVLKESTVIKCQTFYRAWFRNNKEVVRSVDKTQFKDMFGYEEEITRQLLANDASCRKMNEQQLQFVVHLKRYSFLHSTRLEMSLEFHQKPFYIPFLVGMAKFIQKLINSELEPTDWKSENQ